MIRRYALAALLVALAWALLRGVVWPLVEWLYRGPGAVTNFG